MKQETIQQIEDMIQSGQYKQAVKLFKQETGLAIKAHFIGVKRQSDVWGGEDKGYRCHHFIVTLVKHGRDFESYSFDFYGSHNDYLKTRDSFARAPQADHHSVLACLSVDYSDNFQDFLNEYGYEYSNEKERKWFKKIYRAVKEQSEQLEKMFDETELEALNAIC